MNNETGSNHLLATVEVPHVVIRSAKRAAQAFGDVDLGTSSSFAGAARSGATWRALKSS